MQINDQTEKLLKCVFKQAVLLKFKYYVLIFTKLTCKLWLEWRGEQEQKGHFLWKLWTMSEK